MRPFPSPDRVARRSTVRFPVIRQAAWPSSSLSPPSLLLTDTILQLAAQPAGLPVTVTETNLLFGGHSTFGVAVSDVHTDDGVVRDTVTVPVQWLAAP